MAGTTNVTIKVDPHMLLLARMRALQYGTSVNAVLATALEELARRPRPTPEPQRGAPSVPVAELLLAGASVRDR